MILSLAPNIYIRIYFLKQEALAFQVKIGNCLKLFILAFDRDICIINDLDILVIIKIWGFVL